MKVTTKERAAKTATAEREPVKHREQCGKSATKQKGTDHHQRATKAEQQDAASETSEVAEQK